jgi:hypothetical protein
MDNLDPLTANIALQIGAWFWNEFGRDVIKKSADIAWRRYKFLVAKQKYQEEVKRLYSTMRVLDKTMPLQDHYVDLFVLEEPEAYRKYGVEYLESGFDDTIGFYNRGNRTDALVVLNENNRLFVLGKPGAGKTTFLKYIATRAAEEKIDRVPIFISFNNWSYSRKDLFTYIVDQFDICGFPDAEKFIELILEKGKALVLFDGLDEVSEEENQRGQMIYELENLIQKYKDNKYVITCRNAASDYKFERSTFTTYVEIADLSNNQINVFVKKWFCEEASQATRFLKELEKEDHQNLKELSDNPLLLGMLCLVFEETAQFPSKRGLVYRDAIDVLVKRWDKERGIRRSKIPGFSPSVEKKLLSFLAYEYLLQNKIYFEQTDIESKIEDNSATITTTFASEDILTAIEVQHGLLARRATRVYSFSHLTFQEYFTAQYIIDHLETDEGLFNNLFTYFNNPRWREVFPLVAGLLSTPSSFFERLVMHIREPIKKYKALDNILQNIDDLATEIQGTNDLITARMQAIALTVSVNRIAYIVQNSADKRFSIMAEELLKFLNLDESIITLKRATEIAKIVTTGSYNIGENRDKVNKVLNLAAKQAFQRDSDFGYSDQHPVVNLDAVRIRLRDQLKKTEFDLTQQTLQNILNEVENIKAYSLAFRIASDFRPGLIYGILGMRDFPKTFASKEEWYSYRKKLIQSEVNNPPFSEKILGLKDEHLPILEQFLKSNIFLLDCIQQAEKFDYSDAAFSMASIIFSD